MGRGGRAGVVLVVVLLVLGGVAVAADRFAANAAEDRIAEQAKKELAARDITSKNPQAHIAGFPFLTQVAAGHYDKITITADEAQGTANGRQVKFDRLTVVAHDVSADTGDILDGNPNAVARTVDGEGVMRWSDVVSLVNVTGLDPDNVQIAEDNGQIRMTVGLNLLGQKLTLVARGGLTVTDGKVNVKITELTPQGGGLSGALVKGALGQVQRDLAFSVAIPALPYGLTVQKVEPTDAGLHIVAQAKNVRLAGNG